jgi:hypothetical protein
MSSLSQKNPNLNAKSIDGQEEGESKDIKVKYHSWYELKRKANTGKCVKQCRMQKAIGIAEKQARCAYEVIPIENVVKLKSLTTYKNHMQKVM